jgi:hypothetical protein
MLCPSIRAFHDGFSCVGLGPHSPAWLRDVVGDGVHAPDAGIACVSKGDLDRDRCCLIRVAVI